MTMSDHEELPRPAAELEQIAAYYDTHDTSEEMDSGTRVDPQPWQPRHCACPPT
jgi:hypothetical protein